MIETALALALAAAPAAAQVRGVAQSCGCYCGKMIPAPCTEAQCIEACGGAPAAKAGGGGLTPAQQTGVGMMQLGVGILQQGFRDAEETRRRKLRLQEQERLRRLEAERRLEEESDRLFREKKNELLKLGAGGATGSLQPKDAYEEEAAPAKDEIWCKLNLIHTRKPARPIEDVAGAYPEALERWRKNRTEWERRCGPLPGSPDPPEEDEKSAKERRDAECERWLRRREAAGGERMPLVRRKELERPEGFDSELYGQLSKAEIDGLWAQARTLGTSVFVCGSYAETDLGLSRRYLAHQLPECRERFFIPDWRSGPAGSKLVSDLIDLGTGDCDVMTLSPHVSPERALESVCGAVFPKATRPDAGYQKRYRDRDALKGSGCLEFAPGAQTPERHRGRWQ
ncbi:MAG: hypothetical protein HY925_00215 [Elusimicrobia bacterium]|nr:hypothetical protein [Elusimicrobiota bacterium]